MKKKTSAFTLIELMTSMTIFFSIIYLAYVPYNHYQNKAKLKITSREISQSFYDAKNMAVSGLKDEVTNRAIGVYLENTTGNNTYLKILSYPHDIEEGFISNEVSGDIKEVKVKNFEKGININYLGGSDNLLFFFDSITGKSKVYTFNGSNKTLIADNENPTEIEIMFSYGNSISPTLQREIIYFTETNIVDYN